MPTRRAVLQRLLVAAPLLSAGGSALLAGCGGSSDNTSDTHALETANTRQRGTYGPLAFALDMPKLDYALDETVEWTFNVQNVSDKPVELRIITPSIKCGIGYKDTTPEDPGYAYFYLFEGELEESLVVILQVGQILTRKMQVTPAQLKDGFDQDYLARGGIRVMPWLSVFEIDGVGVPPAPLYNFTGTTEGYKPSIVSLVQTVSIR